MTTPPFICYEEITTQHIAWQKAIEIVDAKEPAIRQFFVERQPDDILIVGCGSPFYMGESVAAYWQSVLKVRCRTAPASELVYYPDAYLPPGNGSSVLVLISRSGSTSETIWAYERFEERNPGCTLLISCAPGSPLDQSISLSVLIPDGYEQTVPQTRSFAAMYLAAQMIGASLSGQSEVVEALRGAPSHSRRIINEWEQTAQFIAEQRSINHAFYMGSGPLYGIAREGALKMTEMSITTCSAYQFMEARHGPRSIIDERTLVTGLFGHAAPVPEAKVMADFIGTSNPLSVALTPTADWETGGARYHLPVGVDWPDGIQGLAYLPIMHLLAYYHAVARGVNPDTSRHLAIFVDLNEV